MGYSLIHSRDWQTQARKAATIMFIAGWNMPGYLPDSDPVEFETRDEAVSYLSDTIERFWDDEYQAAYDDDIHAELEEIANRWTGVAEALNYQDGSVTGDDSLVFWIERI